MTVPSLSKSLIIFLKKVLNNTWASVLCFFLGGLGRVLVQLHFFMFVDDRSLQIISARNLSAGRGITINQYLPNNLLEESLVPLTGWPPGYAVFLSTLDFFINNILLSAVLFDLITILIFFYFSRRILILLGCSVIVVNLYTLLVGFFLYPFSLTSTTDTNAVAFFICTLYQTLKFINDKKQSIFFGIIIGLLNFTAPFLRYMFIPLAFIFPSYLIYWGSRTNDKRIYKGGVIATIITSLLIAGLLYFQKVYTGSATHVYQTPTGFFPANLLRFYPVTITSFVDIGFYYTLANNLNLLTYGKGSFLFTFSHVILSIWLVRRFILFYHNKQNNNPLGLTHHYIYVAGIASLIICGLLSFLSVYYAAQSGGWTYVQENRYVAFITIFLQHLIFIYVYQRWGEIKSKIWRITSLVISFFLLFEILHGIYFSSKLVPQVGSLIHESIHELPHKISFSRLITQMENKYSPTPVFYFSEEVTYLNVINMLGGKCIYKMRSVGMSPSLAFPAVIIIILKSSNKKRMGALESNPKVHFIRAENGLHYFEYKSF